MEARDYVAKEDVEENRGDRFLFFVHRFCMSGAAACGVQL